MDLDTVKIVEYKDEYADKISELITRNLTEVNIKDYPQKEIDRLVALFTPDKIILIQNARKTFVAIINNQPIGTLSVAKSWNGDEGDYQFLTIFVLPDYHGKGIGKLLMEMGEGYVREINGRKITIPASITAHRFYEKLGYQYIDGIQTPDEHGVINMIKLM